MPQAKTHIIEGAGHDLTLTIPDQVASAMMDFLSGDEPLIQSAD
jgi:pimeloyl-ACP methyl ester carboxylesterase